MGYLRSFNVKKQLKKNTTKVFFNNFSQKEITKKHVLSGDRKPLYTWNNTFGIKENEYNKEILRHTLEVIKQTSLFDTTELY